MTPSASARTRETDQYRKKMATRKTKYVEEVRTKFQNTGVRSQETASTRSRRCTISTMKRALVLLPIIASVINGPLAAQWANYPTPGIPRSADGKPNLTAPAPRTPDGKPDLSGLWDKISPRYGRNIAADLKH